jgi:hypothetical protein
MQPMLKMTTASFGPTLAGSAAYASQRHLGDAKVWTRNISEQPAAQQLRLDGVRQLVRIDCPREPGEPSFRRA